MAKRAFVVALCMFVLTHFVSVLLREVCRLFSFLIPADCGESTEV